MIYNLSNKVFNLVENSEGIEGYKFNKNTVDVDSSFMKNINRATILEFLKLEETKIYVEKDDKTEQYSIIAHNSVSNESISIKGLGNHAVALFKVVETADAIKQQLKEHKSDVKILTNDFIKSINAQILLNRYGEVGIGEYRTVDFFGNPVEVQLCEIVDGKKQKVDCVDLETSVGGNIVNKMDELVNFVNSKKFKEGDVLVNIAKFHADFIRIHLFRDGNGRTVRLLTNYLLILNGYPMINIPVEAKKEYFMCLDYANAKSEKSFIKNEENKEFYMNVVSKQGFRSEENKYNPLAVLFEKCFVKRGCGRMISEILDYKNKGDNQTSLQADQVAPLY